MEPITDNIFINNFKSFVANISGTCGDIFIGSIGSLLAVYIAWKATRIITNFRNRSFIKFWQTLSFNTISIIYPEYNPIGNDESSLRIRSFAGKVISKGTAMAIHEFLNLVKTNQYSYNLIGSKSGSENANNLIILGSPRSNPYSETMFRVLDEKFEMPISFVNEKLNCYIKIKDDLSRTPDIKGNSGTDYAVIVKANYSSDQKRFVVIAAGCQMYGTWAAAKALCDPIFLINLTKKIGISNNIVAVLKILDSPKFSYLKISSI